MLHGGVCADRPLSYFVCFFLFSIGFGIVIVIVVGYDAIKSHLLLLVCTSTQYWIMSGVVAASIVIDNNTLIKIYLHSNSYFDSKPSYALQIIISSSNAQNSHVFDPIIHTINSRINKWSVKCYYSEH